MGFLRNQIGRLLRQKWGSNADLLAEEIAAIFNSDEPIEIDSPVVITTNNNEAPLTIRNFGDTDNSINIERGVPPGIYFPEIPPIEIGDVGDFNFSVIYDDGTSENFPDWEPGDPTPPRGSGEQEVETPGGGGFAGKVVSRDSGQLYDVDVYEEGLAAEPVRRTVRQLQIADDAEIPADTWAIVGKTGDSYFMQVPVWLDEPEEV